MPIECTTVGMKFAYCVETTAGTRPTTGFTVLNGIVSVGAITITQNPLQVTLPAEKKYRYLKGKDDISGEVDVVMYNEDSYLTGWETMRTAAKSARASGKSTWFAFLPDGNHKAFAFTASPGVLGSGGLSDNMIYEVNTSLTVEDVGGYVDKPTVKADSDQSEVIQHGKQD